MWDEPRNECALLPSNDFLNEFPELNRLTEEEFGCLQRIGELQLQNPAAIAGVESLEFSNILAEVWLNSFIDT